MTASYDTSSRHFDDVLRMAKCPARAQTVAGIDDACRRLWPDCIPQAPADAADDNLIPLGAEYSITDGG